METGNINVTTAPAVAEIGQTLDHIEKVNNKLVDTLNELSAVKVDLANERNITEELRSKRDSIYIYGMHGVECSNLTLEEAKRELDNFYKEKYAKDEESATAKLAKLTLALDTAKQDYVISTEKANLKHQRELYNVETDYKRTIDGMRKDYDTLTEKYESLKENKQYETRLQEIEDLKKKLRKANRTLLNLKALINWFK